MDDVGVEVGVAVGAVGAVGVAVCESGAGCAGRASGVAVCDAVAAPSLGQKLCRRSMSSVSLILASLVGLWRGFRADPRFFMPVGFLLVGMLPVWCGRLFG